MSKIKDFLDTSGLIFIYILMCFSFLAGFHEAAQHMNIEYLNPIWIIIMILCIIVIDIERLCYHFIKDESVIENELVTESNDFMNKNAKK